MEEEEKRAIAELMEMSHEELLLVDHEKLKWICSGKGCCRSTKIFDFGIWPIIYHHRMKPKWMDMNKWYFMCAKHYKLFKRLAKNFPEEKVRDKILDFNKKRVIK